MAQQEMTKSDQVLRTDRFFIGGEWVPSDGPETIEVVNPVTGVVFGSVPRGTAADADKAVEAARRAFAGWASTPPLRRAELLTAVIDGLEARGAELEEILLAEVGMPRLLTQLVQVGHGLAESRALIAEVAGYSFEETIGSSLVVREPIGVVVAITPWNFPLVQALRKIVPALAAGCTVVFKPSEQTPIDAFVLAEVVQAAGIPAGVFNLVTGYGPEIGEAMVVHPEVDMISLTGSTVAGRRVSELGSKLIKRVSLELGGKSPSVILEDADMDTAVRGTLGSTFLNSGQVCTAHTRLLVPRSRLAEAEAAIVELVGEHKVGLPDDAGVTMGPLISAKQRERVLTYIQKGVDEGARVLLGGPDAQDPNGAGYFVYPTVFTDVDPGMVVEQEEIFGPVLSVIPYDSEDDAVAIANGTIYGLAAGVWSGDDVRARDFAKRIRAGQVDVNGGGFNYRAPFGGYKQSGVGRENGRYGLEEFLEVKSLQL